MTYGALSVFERDSILTADLIDKSVETFPLAMKEYAPDGAYPEGVGYWDYCGLHLEFSPAPFWFYVQTKDSLLLRYQKQLLENDREKRFLEHRLLPLALLWGAGVEAKPANSGEPESRFWIRLLRHLLPDRILPMSGLGRMNPVPFRKNPVEKCRSTLFIPPTMPL